MGSGDHRINVRGGGRSGNDDATGAALHSVESGVGSGCGVVEKIAGVAGDPSTSRSGARTFAGSPATWRLLKPSWVGGGPQKRRNRQLYEVDLLGHQRH
jgi:hypothetical protein